MADVLTHHCPNCGGPLTFDPNDQKFHCDYCLSIFTVETINQTAPETQAEPEKALDLFSCPSCGAQIVTDATTAATYCYFCHNPVILSERVSGKFLPSKVLPFKIDHEKAVNDFLAWTKRKRFVPKEFFNQAQIEKMTGVYFPYWVVDANTAGELSGEGTALRVWRIGDIEYTETKIYQVYRKGTVKIKNLVKNALTKNTQQKMVEAVQPFPVEQAVDFHTEYLSGFQAEKRDLEIADLDQEITNELKNYTENLLRDSATGYTTFVKNTNETSVQTQDNHYMLFPVWLVTYHDRAGKVYYYAMNGQTGKISGVLPISNGRLALTSAMIFAITALLGMIVGYFA